MAPPVHEPGRPEIRSRAGAAPGPAPRVEFVLLGLVTALGAALRLARLTSLAPDLAEAAHFLTANPGQFPLPRAWSAALGAVAPVIVWLLLRRGAGPWPALAAATLVAMTPWAVHVGRSGSTLGAAFLAELVLFAALRALRPAAALIVGALALAAAAWATARAELTPEAFDPASWLVADVGLGSLVFAGAAFCERTGRRRAALVAVTVAALATALLLRFDAASAAASVTAGLLVLAGSGLGAWWDAAERPLLRGAALALAVVPSLPTLFSEVADGGRYDLKPLAAAFDEQRRSGEPLFASDPVLVGRAFGVECRPLPANARTPADFLPADRAGWVVLLFDRGRTLGDAHGLAPALERELALVARSSRKRFDLHRLEARLYRRVPPKGRAP